MSLETYKKNSFRQSSITRIKYPLIAQRQDVQSVNSVRKLPLIKEKKYSSSRNLVTSITHDVNPILEDNNRNSYLNKLKKKINKRASQKHISLAPESQSTQATKYFFQKRDLQLKTLKFQPGQLRKYSSCNKLTSFPSIPEIIWHQQNDQSLIINDNQIQNYQPYFHYKQRQIKSSNSIKLDTLQGQYIKKPTKLQRIPLRKIVKSNMSKTINPRKVQSQNSIELENEQKNNLVVKRKGKILNKDHFDLHKESKTKILVKNPFHKLPKKSSQTGQKIVSIQNFQRFQQQFRLSNIFQDAYNQSEISINGKTQIQDLIEQLDN